MRAYASFLRTSASTSDAKTRAFLDLIGISSPIITLVSSPTTNLSCLLMTLAPGEGDSDCCLPACFLVLNQKLEVESLYHNWFLNQDLLSLLQNFSMNLLIFYCMYT